jgi:hypothetical protein
MMAGGFVIAFLVTARGFLMMFCRVFVVLGRLFFVMFRAVVFSHFQVSPLVCRRHLIG